MHIEFIIGIFGAVFFCVMAIPICTEKKVIRLIGPKVCERLCIHMVGCSAILYTTFDPMCSFSNVNASQEARERGKYFLRVSKDKERLYAERNMICQKNSMIYRNRKGKLRCRLHSWQDMMSEPQKHGVTITSYGELSESDVKPLSVAMAAGYPFPVVHGSKVQLYTACDQSDSNIYMRGRPRQRKDVIRRLLILPFTGSMGHQIDTRQLLLHNNTLATYRFLNTKVYLAAAYIEDLKKLVIATDKPPELFFIPVDNTNKTVILKNKTVVGIALDNRRQLMFLAISNIINTLTTRGDFFTKAITLKYQPWGIAVDPKRSHVFVTDLFHCIEKYTYKGDLVKEVASGHIRKTLCLDAERDFLYYLEGLNVCILSLCSDSNTVVPGLRINAISLFVVENTFYLTPFKAKPNKLIIANKQGVIKSLYYGYKRQVTVCGIP